MKSPVKPKVVSIAARTFGRDEFRQAVELVQGLHERDQH
jgi:hypothetical protein